jgi:hypothetical protein
MRNLKQFFLGLVIVAVLGFNLGVEPRNQAMAVTIAQTAPVVIFDGTFNPGDWSVQEYSQQGASQTHAQSLTGGNPAAFRSMQHILPPPPSGQAGIDVIHVYEAQSYDPSTQGAIDHLDYSEDTVLLDLPHRLTYLASYPVIVQDGRVYQSSYSVQVVDTRSWTNGSLSGLKATDFFALDYSVGTPDFSTSGGPMKFGFWRGSSRFRDWPVPADQTLIYEHGIDNFTVTIHPAPNRAPIARDDRFIIYTSPDWVMPETLHPLWNDSDPDGDTLTISSVADPDYGSALLDGHSRVSYALGDSAVDYFDYTITDGQLFDTATVTVLIDCGCTVRCLEFIHGTRGSAGLPDLNSASLSAQQDNINIPLLYRVRDEVMKPTPHGNRYVDMYYHTTPEILWILLVDSPGLSDEAVATVELWQDDLRNLLDSDGSAIVTQAQIDAIESFLTNLSAAGSADLQQLIADELARLGPLDAYVGLTVKEAKSKAIGDPTVYLPIVLR